MCWNKSLIAVLVAVGKCKGNAGCVALPGVQAVCYLCQWEVGSERCSSDASAATTLSSTPQQRRALQSHSRLHPSNVGHRVPTQRCVRGMRSCTAPGTALLLPRAEGVRCIGWAHSCHRSCEKGQKCLGAEVCLKQPLYLEPVNTKLFSIETQLAFLFKAVLHFCTLLTSGTEKHTYHDTTLLKCLLTAFPVLPGLPPA